MQFEDLTKTYKELLDATTDILNSLRKAKFRLFITLDKSHYESYNNREIYLNLGNGNAEAFIREVREAINKIDNFNIAIQLELVSTLGDEYTRISSQDIHPDQMKAEMLTHLAATFVSFRSFIEAEDLLEALQTLQNNVNTLFENIMEREEHICNIRQFCYLLCECEHQYMKNIHFLRTLMEYFSTPTECPPRW